MIPESQCTGAFEPRTESGNTESHQFYPFSGYPTLSREVEWPSPMARRSRQDQPGSWHHVINRGLAKRPLFEGRRDARFFLSRIANEVRRGRLEVHTWSVLPAGIAGQTRSALVIQIRSEARKRLEMVRLGITG